MDLYCSEKFPIRFVEEDGNVFLLPKDEISDKKKKWCNIGQVQITAYLTKHIPYSYAYLVEGEGKRVLLSGDLCHKGPQHDFPISVLDAPLDLAVCECAHFTADKYFAIFAGKKNLKRLYFTHFQDKYLDSILKLKTDLPEIPISRAQDGTEIVL